jgi:WD40 repeat protein
VEGDVCIISAHSLVDVWSLAFSSDSRTLATGSHNGRINIFSVEEGQKKSSLDTRGKFIMSVAYVSGIHAYGMCESCDMSVMCHVTWECISVM